ncbi:MAG: bifunctional DNA-binding transcriptional regulator/O6-methylguanine-DNA methyltransferase Ada [Firmicutes bacterium]|nr:bifunctional DNA-binding transcriptional regulator/O6-methylguanine-DNA methyltransferase Ada [Bacillota bacterium]
MVKGADTVAEDRPLTQYHTVSGSDSRWRAVLDRDRSQDGLFVYAVNSTRIYCRPSCAARRPRRERVSFFSSPGDAERAGFRPCLRCRPDLEEVPDHQVELVRQACRAIESHDGHQPLTLASLAALLHIDPYHLQKTFKKHLGVTPREYLSGLRRDRLKQLCREGWDVASALHQAGYGSSSRLYESAPTILGMTPGAYSRGGKGMSIGYTLVDSPLGRLLAAATPRGVCAVYLGESDPSLEEALAQEYPAADIRRDDAGLQAAAEELVAHLAGRQPSLDLPLDIRATAFQLRVYQELKAIPYGGTSTYQEIAERLGDPGACRAVARACAGNPAALLIPCHRVVRKDGGLAGYRWGIERKKRLLETEKEAASRTEAEAQE